MIDRIAGIIIWTSNLDQLFKFYRDILELKIHSTRPDFVAFDFGDSRLSIGAHSKVSGYAMDKYRIMINFETSDIHKAHLTLSARGVAFIRTPSKEQWGGWVATFQDPDSNVLQLLQRPTSPQY